MPDTPATSDGRWAVYLVPPRDHPLWTAACTWLGRDPETGTAPAAAAGDEAIVATPARYGFHATLKPPFRLADGASAERLRARAADFAAARSAFTLPPLQVTAMAGFLALMPIVRPAAADALAADCVRCFDALRAPLTAGERERRHPARLTLRQRQLLDRWGYPFVFDQFRLHFTLTGPLDDHAREAVRRDAAAHFQAALDVPLTVREIALYHERAGGMAFDLVQRLPLGG